MTDKKQDAHADLMNLVHKFGMALSSRLATGSSKAFDDVDTYARTLTDRIAELEAQLEAVGAGGIGAMLPRHAQPAPAVVKPVELKGGMTAANQSRELDAGFAAQNYCRSKWGAARGHAEWRRYHDAFVAGYLAAPQPQQIAEPASRRTELSTADIERGWRQTFSTDNPFCPCNLRSFTKSVEWAEREIAKEQS